jgi:hypothetical protein
MFLAIVIFTMILFPVLIPTGVHVCHGIANWRRNYDLFGRSSAVSGVPSQRLIEGKPPGASEEVPALPGRRGSRPHVIATALRANLFRLIGVWTARNRPGIT